MRSLENFCMRLPKALEMTSMPRAVKNTRAAVAQSTGGTKCAAARMSWHLWHLNLALLDQQDKAMATSWANAKIK